MSLPAVAFIGETVPDKKLEKSTVYRYYPTPAMKEEILKSVREHLKCDLEEYIIDLKIEVDLKLYNTKPVDKTYWYDKPTDDTKNT